MSHRLHTVVLATTLAVSLLACAGDGDDHGCPSGTAHWERVDDADPTLVERWCARADGTAHGPYTLTRDGLTLVSGGFDDGLAHGAWHDHDALGALERERHFYRAVPCDTWRTWAAGEVVTEQPFRACADLATVLDTDGPRAAPSVSRVDWDGACGEDEPLTASWQGATRTWCPSGTGPYQVDFAHPLEGAVTVEGWLRAFVPDAASLAWRDKLRRAAGVVFFLEPARRARYQDHNASGTVEEEISDLRSLVAAATDDIAVLGQAGFGPEDLATGEHLLAEADGRDVLAVLGIRSQSDIKTKRDTYLTLAVTLGRYARACADVAFFADPATNERFRRVSFAKALRRIRPIRPGRDAAPPIDGDEPADPADMPAVTTIRAPVTTETPLAEA